MTIEYKKNVAVFSDVCTIEEAEDLLKWLDDHPKGKVNLKACKHIHTALLQVLMVKKPLISSAPQAEGVHSLVAAAALV